MPGSTSSQIFADGNVQFAAALDDAEDGGDLWARLLAADMQPILPANPIGASSSRPSWSRARSPDAHEARQLLPARQRVGDRPCPQWTSAAVPDSCIVKSNACNSAENHGHTFLPQSMAVLER